MTTLEAAVKATTMPTGEPEWPQCAGNTLIGTQFADGSVERMLRVTGLDDPDVLTLGEARQLARTLFHLCEENH